MEQRNTYNILVEKPRTILLWRSRYRQEDNIKMDLKEISYVCVD
jgi:hypothetical protein